MSTMESVRSELEASAVATRRHLERVPADKLDWNPAEKSLTLGQLALHIAEAPPGVSAMALNDSFDMSNGPGFRQPESVQEILDAFDKGLNSTYENLDKLASLPMDGMIDFTSGGATLFQMSRGAIIREIVLNHTYHHRGQLGVYLRILGVPVPSTYGPSADEGF